MQFDCIPNPGDIYRLHNRRQDALGEFSIPTITFWGCRQIRVTRDNQEDSLYSVVAFLKARSQGFLNGENCTMFKREKCALLIERTISLLEESDVIARNAHIITRICLYIREFFYSSENARRELRSAKVKCFIFESEEFVRSFGAFRFPREHPCFREMFTHTSTRRDWGTRTDRITYRFYLVSRGFLYLGISPLMSHCFFSEYNHRYEFVQEHSLTCITHNPSSSLRNVFDAVCTALRSNSST
ncbi:MAG: hypothetical protein SP1CHLAM54_03270 [Chlamydiia bacterium]|nr:hypothetical protein [Chlamydiia bacterium]MCH9615243.1 hypothetical protein [Chlamydiia bacterium]MCH9628435.1 hypothetical protein [Chlamydiia bacterium]